MIKKRREGLLIEKIPLNFKLEKGDVICRDGHVQIYIGNNETDNFGWGKVSRSFPVNYNFSLIESKDDNISEIMRDNNKEKHYIIRMDKGYGIEEYTRVYRYVGGSLNEE